MNYQTADLAARFQMEAINRRATLLGSLGALPAAPALLPAFRRRVVALPAAIDVRHGSDKARISRRLYEVSAHAPQSERKAS